MSVYENHAEIMSKLAKEFDTDTICILVARRNGKVLEYTRTLGLGAKEMFSNPKLIEFYLEDGRQTILKLLEDDGPPDT